MLLNIYFNNMFYFLRGDVCNLADYTKLYVSNKKLDFALARLEEYLSLLLNGLRMKMNSYKCYLIILGKTLNIFGLKRGQSNS